MQKEKTKDLKQLIGTTEAGNLQEKEDYKQIIERFANPNNWIRERDLLEELAGTLKDTSENKEGEKIRTERKYIFFFFSER